MNREKAIKILRKISPFILPAPRDRDAIRFAIDFMENHQKPTEQDTAHEPIMTYRENKIYNMVHTWCDEQAQDIPDQNRRYLMDAIVGMIDPQQDEPSEGIEAELIGVNLLNNTLTFQYGQQPFELKEGKYLIKRIDQ